MSDNGFVIVGGGLAGATAAVTMRDEGYQGSVTIVAGEAHYPYIRPPLSKEYLKGDAEIDSVAVQPDDWYDEHDVAVLRGQKARRLDPSAHRLELDAGEALGYDRLLIATGATPRRVTVPGSDAAGIHYLRTIDDSRELRDALAAGGRSVVIVGSGWIGLEVASAARGYGNDVTVIGRESVPLSAVLGERIGAVFGALHRENGVDLRLPAGIRAFEQADGRVTGVVTDSETVPADLVVVGVGATPIIDLAQAAGLTIDNGILTDERLRTSAADVYAAGDVANAYHPVVQRHMRNEHWANALNSGGVAAKSMLGQDVVFDDIPYFYTDQFDLGMEYSGYPPLTSDAAVVVRGDLDSREFIAFWHRDGRVVAGMNVNVWDVNEDVQALIRSGRRVDPGRLADADVPLAEL